MGYFVLCSGLNYFFYNLAHLLDSLLEILLSANQYSPLLPVPIFSFLAMPYRPYKNLNHKKTVSPLVSKTIHLSQKNKPTVQNGELIISIQDWGCGISAETKKQIFTPFYTTKDKGIGLGMSITKNIIDEHQAEIWIESIPDKTTTVFLKFYQAGLKKE